MYEVRLSVCIIKRYIWKIVVYNHMFYLFNLSKVVLVGIVVDSD